MKIVTKISILELKKCQKIFLAIADKKNLSRLREIVRMREVLAEIFFAFRLCRQKEK